MSNTQRWIHPSATKLIGTCIDGTCSHFCWNEQCEKIQDIKQCLHFASMKSLSRDRKSLKCVERFNHDQRNSLNNLLEKNAKLALREALDDKHTPRYRHNHTKPYDSAKEWNRIHQRDRYI